MTTCSGGSNTFNVFVNLSITGPRWPVLLLFFLLESRQSGSTETSCVILLQFSGLENVELLSYGYNVCSTLPTEIVICMGTLHRGKSIFRYFTTFVKVSSIPYGSSLLK